MAILSGKGPAVSGKLRVQATASQARPSPPEPTMRQERTIQATIFEVFAQHEIGCELKAMSQWLDGQLALVSRVAGDLCRQGVRETGRRGLPAESVLRCALLKQQRQLSYEELAFHLEDSASFRVFARLPLGWSPKKSVLQQTISALRPQTWEAVNQALLVSAQQEKLESGATVRIDSTVSAALMPPAERQYAVMGCGAGHDATAAPGRAVAGSAGDAVARSPASGQKAGARHRLQPRQGQEAGALSPADRRRPGHSGRVANGRRRAARDRRDGGRAVARRGQSLSAADRAHHRPERAPGAQEPALAKAGGEA